MAHLISVLCDDLEGWDGGRRGALKGGDMCIHMTDSHCCTVEINTTL